MDSDSLSAAKGSWPADHRAALVVFIHVDAPDLDRVNEPLSTGLDYTATGLQRLLRNLADLDVTATLACSPRALSSFPQLAHRAQDQGHELVLCGVSGLDSHDEALLSRISDKVPRGIVEWLPIPGLSAAPPSGSRQIVTQQPAWVVTGVGGDLPISTLDQGGQATTVIPVSPYWIDTTWLAPDRPLPPSSLLEAWSLALGEVRSEGGLMSIVLHPHVSGRPGFAGQVQRFLDEVIESGDVWIATAAQIADWWREQEEAGQ